MGHGNWPRNFTHSIPSWSWGIPRDKLPSTTSTARTGSVPKMSAVVGCSQTRSQVGSHHINARVERRLHTLGCSSPLAWCVASSQLSWAARQYAVGRRPTQRYPSRRRIFTREAPTIDSYNNRGCAHDSERLSTVLCHEGWGQNASRWNAYASSASVWPSRIGQRLAHVRLYTLVINAGYSTEDLSCKEGYFFVAYRCRPLHVPAHPCQVLGYC